MQAASRKSLSDQAITDISNDEDNQPHPESIVHSGNWDAGISEVSDDDSVNEIVINISESENSESEEGKRNTDIRYSAANKMSQPAAALPFPVPAPAPPPAAPIPAIQVPAPVPAQESDAARTCVTGMALAMTIPSLSTIAAAIDLGLNPSHQANADEVVFWTELCLGTTALAGVGMFTIFLTRQRLMQMIDSALNIFRN